MSGNVRTLRPPTWLPLGSACPKCLSEDASTAWHPGGTLVNDEQIGENLHRTCRTCGFLWLERPADYDQTGGAL